MFSDGEQSGDSLFVEGNLLRLPQGQLHLPRLEEWLDLLHPENGKHDKDTTSFILKQLFFSGFFRDHFLGSSP